MNSLKLLLISAVCALILSNGAAAVPISYSEPPDLDELSGFPATATTSFTFMPGSNTISGNVSREWDGSAFTLDDVDSFRFEILPGNVLQSITVTFIDGGISPDNGTSLEVAVFDEFYASPIPSAFIGLGGATPGDTSTVFDPLGPGTYFSSTLVSGGVFLPNTVASGTADYTVAFNVVEAEPLPAPATVLLMILGLGVLRIIRKRDRA